MVGKSNDDWASEIMVEVCSFWRQLSQEGYALPGGVAVFYGPVRQQPGMMLIGINPGGGPESFDPERCERIPARHEYVEYEHDVKYPIAGRMCRLFRGIGRFELLEQSVKLNLNFFRTRGEAQLRELPRPLRTRMRQFCEPMVDRIISHFKPKVILAEGIGTYTRLKGLPSLLNFSEQAESRGDRLYRRSQAEGRLLVGIRHPTGPGHPGQEKWEVIGSRLRADLTRLGL